MDHDRGHVLLPPPSLLSPRDRSLRIRSISFGYLVSSRDRSPKSAANRADASDNGIADYLAVYSTPRVRLPVTVMPGAVSDHFRCWQKTSAWSLHARWISSGATAWDRGGLIEWIARRLLDRQTRGEAWKFSLRENGSIILYRSLPFSSLSSIDGCAAGR